MALLTEAPLAAARFYVCYVPAPLALAEHCNDINRITDTITFRSEHHVKSFHQIWH